MAKKKASGIQGKAAAKAVKKAKAAQKTERKEKKKTLQSRDNQDDDDDLEGILEKMRREWEDAHKVTEELVEGPPSRRANATLTTCPSGNYLWCIGGEFFSDDGKAYFYNDIFRYSPEKDEWRKFVSPTCPGPRSAHATVSSPAGGGKLFLFGGEFSSLYQNSFHHYRDFWCFDVTTRIWDRVETKIKPSARSGHRMAMWKHYIFLFGGFYDPGIRTNYLNDLWYFDTQEYVWRQVEFKENERKPSPRSGFSFLPTTDGIVLHGGYCKEYTKGKRPVGVMLEDTWFLKVSTVEAPTPTTSKSSKAASGPPLALKWEKRKKVGYAPTLRSGCTMANWSAKSMGVLFGGVTDEDTSEETLESIFHNDLYGYQLAGNGRWVSMTLKKPKNKNGEGKKNKKPAKLQRDNNFDEDDTDGNSDEAKSENAAMEIHPDDPILTTPIVRYNAMLAVLGNTLYIYGGIFEHGSREYTLDDFYSLRLDKLDKYTCLKPCDVVVPKEGDVVQSSSDDDDDDDDDDDNDESDEYDNEGENTDNDNVNMKATDIKEKEVVVTGVDDGDNEADEPENDLRTQAQVFMGVSKDTTRSAEDVISTPLPGETLAMFYARSRDHWSARAHESSQNKGKALRKDGFSLAQEKYDEYKPILAEVEKILAEAGLDEEEIKQGALAKAIPGSVTQSRNRR